MFFKNQNNRNPNRAVLPTASLRIFATGRRRRRRRHRHHHRTSHTHRQTTTLANVTITFNYTLTTFVCGDGAHFCG